MRIPKSWRGNTKENLARRAEKNSLPKTMPDKFELFLRIRGKLKTLGAEPKYLIQDYGGEQGEAIMEDWDCPVQIAAWEEASAQYSALLAIFGKPAEMPFLTRAANIQAGKWVARKPGAKRGTLREVDFHLSALLSKVGVEAFLAHSTEALAEYFHKKSGKTTTRQTVTRCPAYLEARKEATAEKVARKIRLRRS